MTDSRVSPEMRKTTRLTVLFTEAEMARLDRVAAFYAQPKSVAAHDMIMKVLSEGYDQIDNDDLAETETKQQTFRERMGLR